MASDGELFDLRDQNEQEVIHRIIHAQIANLYSSPAGDPGGNPRFLKSPDKDAEEVVPYPGTITETEIWEEIFPENATTPTYILRYLVGDEIPLEHHLRPSYQFQRQNDQ